ncbi:MAG: DUF481 domain-containing protein [Sphingomonadales bacterium]|nr:DUF481 domain-containing protein [Sphingomonadales bacterium]
MTRTLPLLSASALTTTLVLSLALPAAAQDTLSGTRALNDRLDDVTESVEDDLARANDDARFGNPAMRQGMSGSASLGYSGKTGNNDSQELSLGARLGYAAGPWAHTLGLVVDYSEADGSKTKEDTFLVYDANYYFNDQFYAFVLGRAERDGLADTAGDTRTDAFLGFGPGYRVVNTNDMAWRVQAGIGVSYLEDGLENSETETGYIASSRFFYRVTPTMFVTNDTDVLYSDTATRINNDLGVNFKVTDVFTTRVSYLTEYNDSRDIRTDNKLGLSLVMNF